MAKRSRQIELIPLVPPAGNNAGSADGYFGPVRHFLETEVYFNDGGMNYFTGQKPAKGYYLRVTPVTRQKTGSGGEMQGFTLFTGQAFKLEDATRFNAKTLDRIAATAQQHPNYETLKQVVIRKNELTIAEALPV